MAQNPYISQALGEFVPEDEAPAKNPYIGQALNEQFLPAATTPAAASSLLKANNVNPDDEARRQKLATQLGKPADLLPATSEAEAALREQDNFLAAEKSPKLAKWLENQQNAKVAVDEVPHLAKVEKAVKKAIAPKEATARNIASGLWTDFKESMIGTVAGVHAAYYGGKAESALYESGLFRAQKDLPPGHPDRVAAEQRYNEMRSAALEKERIARGVKTGTEENIQAAKPEMSNLAELHYDIAAGIGRMAPMLATLPAAAIGATGSALAAATAGIAAVSGLTIAGVQTGADAYTKYRERGATFQKAMVGTSLEAGAEIGFGMMPMGYAANKLGREGLKEFFIGAGKREVPGEIATYIANSATDTAIANPDKTWQQWMDELPEGIAQTAYAAMFTSMALSAPHAGVRLLGHKVEKAEDAENLFTNLQEANDLIANAATKTRAQEAFAEFMQGMKDDGDLTHLYVNPEVLQQVMLSPEGAALEAQIPGIKEALAHAHGSAGDVQISTGDYFAHIMGTPFAETIMRATKADPDGATYAQAENTFKTIPEEMQKLAEEQASMKVLTREEFDAKQLADEQAALAQPVKDRRSYDETGARIDRRQDAERRATIREQLATITEPKAREEFLIKEVYTDQLTRLRSLRGYEDLPRKAHQAAVDIDALGITNDTMGHAAGDQLLRAFGTALESVGAEAYRVGGDEVMVQHDDLGTLQKQIQEARAILDQATIRAELPDGSIMERKGLGFSFGIGNTREEADVELYKDKTARTEAGLRVEKGKGLLPPGMGRVPAERVKGESEAAAAKAPRQTYEEYLAAHPNKDAIFELDAKQVDANIVGQLVATRRYSDAVSEANAKPISAWYRTMAKLLGIKPTELYARYPLKITADARTAPAYAQSSFEIDGARRRTTNTEGAPISLTKKGVENFWNWFGDSKLVDDEGRPMVLYHGTTGDFSVFDPTKANPESDLGAGFYFSTTKEDVAANYAGFGPDLTNRVQARVDQIESNIDDEDTKVAVESALGKPLAESSDEETAAAIRTLVRKEFANTHEGMTLPVYLAIKKPFIIGGKQETFLDYWFKEDGEGGIIGGPEGALAEFRQALIDVLDSGEFDDISPDQVLADLDEYAVDNGGVNATGLWNILKTSEGLTYATDDSGRLAASEVIREALARAGFDGIIDNTVPDKFGPGRMVGAQMAGMARDTVHVVAFAPNQIKSALGNRGEFDPAEADILAQNDRGAFDPTTLTIRLLRSADLSTMHHEAAHFFLEALTDIATRPDAPAEVAGMLDTTLAWFEVSRESWKAMSLEERRKYHEQWAVSYERWLLEGRAPAVGMQSLFARFRTWMLSVYRSVQEFVNKNPDAAKLNDEVRQVFAKMLASEDAIKQAEQVRGYEELFTAAEAAGLNVKDTHEAATDAAIQKLERATMRDMKWLSNAKSKTFKKLQAEAKQVRAMVEAEVREEVSQLQVNKARSALKGKDAPHKLHTGALREQMPDLNIDALRGMTSQENGTHPDQLADMFGYQSGPDLVNALLTAEPMEEMIQGMTDQRMIEEHADISDSRALNERANREIANDARARFLASSLRALTKSEVPVSQLKKAAEQAAEALIGRQKIRDVKPARYEAAETKNNREVITNLAKDPRGAIVAQRSSLLNNRLANAAHGALEEVDTGLSRIKRLQKKAAQQNMRGEFLDQLNELLARFDLSVSRTLKAIDEAKVPFKQWLEEYADDISAVMPDIPEWLYNEGYRKHYKDLTVDEFRGLMDTIKGLELLARREQKQYKAIRDMDFQTERTAILDRIRAKNPSAFSPDGEPLGMETKFVKTFGDTVSKLGDKFAGEFLNAESIVNLLEDGEFGQLHESFIGRLSTGLDWKSKRLGEVFYYMKDKFKPYSVREKRAFSSKAIGKIKNTAIAREHAVSIALLHGNAEGRERLANYGWSEQDQLKAIELLDSKDLDLVEGIWSLFDDQLWPELEAVNMRTRGTAPPKVLPVPFTVNGRQMRGGYYRLKYERGESPKAKKLAEVDDLKALRGGTLGMGAKTAQGASEARKQNVKRKPRLDLGVFTEAVSETIHDIALREAVADTARLLSDTGIYNAIVNTAGEAQYDAIMQRVRDVAARPRDPAGFIEKAASVARKNTIVTLMSGLGTALQNVTGIIPAMHRVSPGLIAKEIGTFWSKERWKFAYEHSAYMRQRHESFDRSLQEEAKKLTGKGQLLPDIGTMLWFMAQTDKLVSVPVWNAAYKDGIKKLGSHDRAVDYADHIVRQTQGAGRDLDTAKIMNGGHVKKLFTMFYSYFNAQLAQLVRAGAVNKKLAKTNPALATALFTKDFLLIVAIPAVLTKLIFAAPSEDEDDKTYLRRSLEAIGQYGLGMIPLIRDVGNFLWGYLDPEMKGWGYKVTPAQSMVEGIGKGIKAGVAIAEGDATTQDVKNAIMGVSYTIGLPGKLIANTVTGIDAVMEGEEPSALIYGAPYKP